MDFIKGWTLNVCVIIIACVLFSMLVPKGNLGRFYKTIVSLLLCVSIFTPFVTLGKYDWKLSAEQASISAENNTDRIISNMIIDKIVNLLEENNIVGADVDCDISINVENEISIDGVIVSVSDGYDKNFVKELIYEELNLAVKVKYIGQ